MTWLNPLAFAGLLTLAIPVLVHLFGRRRARHQRFPSLRLLPLSTPNPARSRQPSDLLLLALRCGIVAMAVLALAQPRWTTAARARDDAVPRRVIVVDSSASLRRLTSNGRPGLDEARDIASALADSSRGALVVETSHPGRELGGAASWLGPRPGVREVVVVSDFQAGAVAEGDLASVPAGIGVRLEKIVTVGTLPESATVHGVSLTVFEDGTEGTWPSRPAVPPAMPRVLAAPADREAVEAALAAAHDLAGASGAPMRRVAVVFAGSPEGEALLSSVAPPDSAWPASMLMALFRDRVLASIASAAGTRSCRVAGAPIAPDASGAPIAIVAGVDRPTGELVISSCVPVGTLAGAAVVARVVAAVSTAPTPGELEPVMLPDELLRRWERPGTPGSAGQDGGESADGRWLWLVSLLLLGVEQWWRQRPAPVKGTVREGADARAA